MFGKSTDIEIQVTNSSFKSIFYENRLTPAYLFTEILIDSLAMHLCHRNIATV